MGSLRLAVCVGLVYTQLHQKLYKLSTHIIRSEHTIPWLVSSIGGDHTQKARCIPSNLFGSGHHSSSLGVYQVLQVISQAQAYTLA
jgi:hypothetical protein